jgi:hypothetical protein
MQMGMMLKLSSGKTTGKLCACIEKEFEILCVIDIVDTISLLYCQRKAL